MDQGASINNLRAQIDRINHNILDQLSERTRLVLEVRKLKEAQGLPLFSPEREQEMLEDLIQRNLGPFSNETIRHIFTEVFRASLNLMETESHPGLSAKLHFDSRQISVTPDEIQIGREPVLVAGPSAVESESQMEAAAKVLRDSGVRFLRAGAFRARTSPYSFCGLGKQGLAILRDVACRHSLRTVSEVTDTRWVGVIAEYVDVLQVGTSNMYNYDLLREVGQTQKPTILARASAATIEDLLLAAECIFGEGNERVILCECGIRTFATQTRATLDISAIPVLKQRARLPVMVDVSRAAGRSDLLLPLAKASLAAGSDGVMIDMHPWPLMARCDAHQQISPEEFRKIAAELGLSNTESEERQSG